MNIRKATYDDIKSITYCIEEAYSKYISRIGKKPASMNMNFFPLVESGSVWILELVDRIIGLVVLITNHDFVEIRSLAILPQFQKMGFGKKMIEYSENYASKHGMKRVNLYTNSVLHELIEYYKKLNYIEEKRELMDGFDRVFFTKDLSVDS